jgi:hypothetical protein
MLKFSLIPMIAGLASGALAIPSLGQAAATTAAGPVSGVVNAPAHGARMAADPNKPICKSEPIPGSRLGGKAVCLTRAQWDQMAQDARDLLRDMSSRRGVENATDGMTGGMAGGMMGSH